MFHVPAHKEADGIISEELHTSMTRTLGEVANLADSILDKYVKRDEDTQETPDTL